jgi:hypothetical protein
MISRTPTIKLLLPRNGRKPDRRSLSLQRLVGLLFGCLLILLAGCGDTGQSGLYPTTGKVTLDGAPLSRASVVFSPTGAGSGSVATGLTDGSGQFTLSTGGREGAAKGTYMVTVFAQDDARPTGGPSPPARGPSGDGGGMRRRPKLLVPERYTLPEKSGLTFTVEPNRNNFKIELVSENRK